MGETADTGREDFAWDNEGSGIGTKVKEELEWEKLAFFVICVRV